MDKIYFIACGMILIAFCVVFCIIFLSMRSHVHGRVVNKNQSTPPQAIPKPDSLNNFNEPSDKPDTCLTDGCGSPVINSPTSLTVLEHTVKLDRSPFCFVCTAAYMNRHSTVCNTCREPICVGQQVAQAAAGSEFPYTHHTSPCSLYAGLWCGTWGEGKLIGLNMAMFGPPDNAS